MISEFIAWLRRDDERLEVLRRRQQELEKEMDMDWEKLQEMIAYILIALGTMGFGVMAAMWILL